MRWIVTGGAGFIGSHFVRTALLEEWATEIVVLDALTYAGNLENLSPVQSHSGFSFVRGDICNAADVEKAIGAGANALFHFAAESHVDRSILSAADFVRTNVIGTQVLLDVARARGVDRYVQVYTDEVYGSLELDTAERFSETTPIDPTSPYAASKAAADHLVLAAQRTHGFNAVITRCTNNYGPYQFPEKFIPLFITNAMDARPLPLYGDGKNVRDWIHVDNHCRGVYLAYKKGVSGQVYNFGGDCERANRDIAQAIVALCGKDGATIQPVADRLAHDRRYAIDASRAKSELGFEPGPSIEARLPEVVAWYRSNRTWWEAIKAGEYRSYYERMYGGRATRRAL
jgi:dTDP-glucose 4,6-dehydratase